MQLFPRSGWSIWGWRRVADIHGRRDEGRAARRWRIAVTPGSSASRTLQTQPTTRYHGNVAAFMAEVRGRTRRRTNSVMVSAASTGELERLADICHEYELPYRIGELEENVDGRAPGAEEVGGQQRAAAWC